MLDGDDAPRRETAAVANAVNLVDDRRLGIARQEKVSVKRMREPVLRFNCAAGCDERLANDLAAEHALPTVLRAAAAEQIVLQLLQIESGQKFFDSGHLRFSSYTPT